MTNKNTCMNILKICHIFEELRRNKIRKYILNIHIIHIFEAL